MDCRKREDTVWGCVVHRPDLKCLGLYLKALDQLHPKPAEVVVIDNDGHSETEKITSDWRSLDVQYVDNSPNRGFNAGFNTLLRRVGDTDYDYLATMTVRARPDSKWLRSGVEKLDRRGARKVGSVATVLVFSDEPENQGRTVCGVGHCYRRDGALLDCGYKVKLDMLEEKYGDCKSPSWVWSPCTGAAVYRIEALKQSPFFPELLDPHGFKSYNCSIVGWHLREQGWETGIAWGATARKNVSGSTSVSPNTPGLLINQELNRVKQVYEHWPRNERRTALQKYLKSRTSGEKDNKVHLGDVDQRIVKVRASRWEKPSHALKFPDAAEWLPEHLDAAKKHNTWMSNHRR